MFKVFVYGTLKQGHGNHCLLSDSTFIGEGITVERYNLLVSGIPFVVRSRDAVTNIKGELYEVDPLTLYHLDILEGHPNWYKREETAILVGGKVITAWLYFNDTERGRLSLTGEY